MSENNLIMTIVLVVAATLLFTGGLTGNVQRSNFAYNPSYVNLGGEVICSPVKEAGYDDNGNPVIWQIDEKCIKTPIEFCPRSSRPFVTTGNVYGEQEPHCRGLAITSANDAFPGIQ